ncbi:MAG: hypothetical protein J6I64_06855, partial [Lachnospiraceae bacterium]|nr:hypothetical protein [Lachnospiraceae bacterium]
MTSPSHHKKETKSKHLRNQLLILMLLIGVLIVLLLVSLALGGNSNDSGTSDDTTSGKTNVETSTAALTESLYSLPGDFLDGYEAANYDKFNSFASENGLGGTLIYFTGSMGEIEIIPTEESGDVYYSVVTIPDGRQWLCALNLALFTDKDYYSDLVGCSAVFCGIYEGYSGTENKPVLYLSKLFVPDTGEIKNGIGSILLLPDDEPSTTDPTS